jgi:hypothetical protein
MEIRRSYCKPSNGGQNPGAHFNLEIGMLEQLKIRTFKILKNKNLEKL